MARFAHGIPPTISLILATALWGVATVIAKALLASVPPLTFLLIQLVPSVSVLWLIVLATGTVRWHRFVPVALLGLLNPGLSYTLSILGLTKTTASVATLLWAAEPALIVLTAWLLRQETVSRRFLIATLSAMCGVLFVSGIAGRSDLVSPSAYGTALILGGVLCCALYTVLSRRIASHINPLPAVAIQQTVGLIWVVAIWPLDPQGGTITNMAALSQRELLGGALSGLMYYAGAFWLYLNALRSVPATTASIFLNLTPVFGIASAYSFLGERLTQTQWIGAATILVSVFALLTWAAPPRTRFTTE